MGPPDGMPSAAAGETRTGPRDRGALADAWAAAVLAYATRTCPPSALTDAIEATFTDFVARRRAREDAPSSDELLRRCVRTAAAARAIDPRADDGEAAHVPQALVEAAEGTLTDEDLGRLAALLAGSGAAAAAEARFLDAERAFADALARGPAAAPTAIAPARPVAELAAEAGVLPAPTAPAAPARERRRGLRRRGRRGAEAVEAAPPRAPLSARRHRALRMLTTLLAVAGTLLIAEGALTIFWQEPFSALSTARAQDDLDRELESLEARSSRSGGVALDALDEDLSSELVEPSSPRERRERARERRQARRERIAEKIRLAAVDLRRRAPVGGPLGTIAIPSLDVKFVVVQGTSPKPLRKGPGHYRATPLPGEGGTVGIAGHRTTYGAPFRHIDAIGEGEEIVVTTPYARFTYVFEKQEIVPAGTSDVFEFINRERLVLSACHPLHSDAQRIIVTARLKDVEPRGPVLASEARRERRIERERRERFRSVDLSAV